MYSLLSRPIFIPVAFCLLGYNACLNLRFVMLLIKVYVMLRYVMDKTRLARKCVSSVN